MTRNFTPFISADDDTRLALKISESDSDKIGQGGRWSAEVSDLDSGIRLVVRDADCGAGCRCAAEVVRAFTVEGREVAPSSLLADGLLKAWQDPAEDALPDGLYVEFSDPTPAALLLAPVDDVSIEGIDVPPGAVGYAFYRCSGRDLRYVGPHVFLSADPVVASGEDMVARGLVDEEFVRSWEERSGASLFGLVKWAEETSSPAGDMVVPLVDGIELVERSTRTRIWPTRLEHAP